MIDQFIAYISQFGNLTRQQITLIAAKASELELRKGEYYAEAGKVLKQVGFLASGIVRICYHDNKGEEITRYFFNENHLLFIWKLFEEDRTLSECIQAITDCKLIVFSRKDWMDISNAITGWDSIVQKIERKNLTEVLDRRATLVSEDATTRYLKFLENFPTLANQIPLSYIASYLGITQSSLSRIRKNIC